MEKEKGEREKGKREERQEAEVKTRRNGRKKKTIRSWWRNINARRRKNGRAE